MLDIYAGKNALITIQQQGLKSSLFSAMLGASGGPKWFTLFGLDKYLFGEFFKGRTEPLNLIGSSAGAFRFAALSQKDPVSAINQLAKHYSETVYSKNADRHEISEKARALLANVYGKHGINEIINNPVYRPHFIVARCKGLTSYENKALQAAGLLSSMMLNRLKRGLLKHQYQRYVFHHPDSSIKIEDPCGFSTHYLPLTQENLADALLASGSIPLVMEGIGNIPGGAPGMYRDGGIIDYHFDIGFKPQNGLILYPHFSSSPKAGWFDKNLNRNINPKYYDKTVMLVPSEQFIQRLPYGKIPDRKDFTEMEASQRIKYWQGVLAMTEYLAESLDKLTNDPALLLRNLTTF
ncbi:patatin-like phospholipase family protein [Thalassotalea ganghwensis]